MIILDESTLKITCPSGDTGQFTMTLQDMNGDPIQDTIDGVGVFAVCQRTGNAFLNIAQITCPIVNNKITVAITPAFSRAIPQGEYYWDMRIVTDPAFDESGNAITDDPVDEVHSLYAAREGGMPRYSVPGVAVSIGGVENA